MGVSLLIISLSVSFTWIFTQALQCPSGDTLYQCVCDSRDNPDRIGGWTQICFNYDTHETAYIMDYSREGVLKVTCDVMQYLTPSLFFNITKANRFTFLNCKVKDSFNKLLSGYQVQELFYQSKEREMSTIFRNLRDLKVLILSRNRLSTLPFNIFSNLTSLEVLNLDQNQLVEISASTFENLQSLNALSLSRNRLKSISEDAFIHLRNLKSLLMSRNSISGLSESLLHSVSSLESLDISYNEIQNVSENFLAKQMNLRRFDAHFNKLMDVPPLLFKNTVQLRIIDISSNPIDILPEDVLTELVSLDIFWASFCKLNNLSENTFANNSNLKEVKLNGNRLEMLPSDLLKNALKLKKLDLSDNPLKFISPEFLASQWQLEWLSIARCSLTNLPEDIFASAFSLEFLDVSSNLLTHLQPNTFINLINLVDLNLRNNTIKSISGGLPFGKSSSLKKVDLSRNHLTRVPNNIQWQNYLRLEFLNLRHNRLLNFSVPLMYSDKVSVLLGNNNISTVFVQELLFHQQILNTFTSSVVKLRQRPAFFFHPNPIKCDCILYDFAKMATSYFRVDDLQPPAIFPLATRLICQSPTNLKGKTLSNVATDEYRCSVEDNCPKDCSCYRRAFDSVTVVDCHSRGLAKLPSVLPTSTRIVHFENNSLSDISPATISLLENCTEIYLSGNDIQSLKGLQFSRKLRKLTLNDNRFNSLMDFVNTASINMTLSGNPYQCDCSDDILRFLLGGQTNIEDLDLIRCNVLKNTSVRYFSSCLFTIKSEFTFRFQSTLFIVLLIILCCFLAIFIHHKHYSVRNDRSA